MTVIETEKPLPPAFADLAPMAKWAVRTTEERIIIRSNATMDELREYYDIVVARADAALVYCEQFDLWDLPEDAANLYSMVLMLAQVSVAIEIHGRPRAPLSPFPHGIRILQNVQPLG